MSTVGILTTIVCWMFCCCGLINCSSSLELSVSESEPPAKNRDIFSSYCRDTKKFDVRKSTDNEKFKSFYEFLMKISKGEWNSEVITDTWQYFFYFFRSRFSVVLRVTVRSLQLQYEVHFKVQWITIKESHKPLKYFGKQLNCEFLNFYRLVLRIRGVGRRFSGADYFTPTRGTKLLCQ